MVVHGWIPIMFFDGWFTLRILATLSGTSDLDRVKPSHYALFIRVVHVLLRSLIW